MTDSSQDVLIEEEEEDDLDSWYKRRIYEPSERDGNAWDGQRKEILALLKCEPREGTVFGWCLYEVLASMSGTQALLVDNEVRELLFSHAIQVQHLFFYKLERKNLDETRSFAVFVAKTLYQGLFSTSCESVLDVLVRQKLGFFPLLFMHVEAAEVYNFIDALIPHEKPPGLMLLIANALCGEIKFQSTRTIQNVPVERLLTLLGSLFEDMKEDHGIWGGISNIIDPLAEFIVDLTVPQHECESVSLHAVDVILRRYSRSVAISIPNFVKAVTRQTRTWVGSLKGENNGKDGESKPRRHIQLQIIELLMSFIKTHDMAILKSLELYHHVENICDALFNQLDCTIFYHKGIGFIQCVLGTRKTSLITQKMIESIVNIFSLNDARRVYVEAVIREIYPIPAYNHYFPAEVVKVMSARTRPTSAFGMTQAEKLDKKIEALTRNMQQANSFAEAAANSSQESSALTLPPAQATPTTSRPKLLREPTPAVFSPDFPTSSTSPITHATSTPSTPSSTPPSSTPPSSTLPSSTPRPSSTPPSSIPPSSTPSSAPPSSTSPWISVASPTSSAPPLMSPRSPDSTTSNILDSKSKEPKISKDSKKSHRKRHKEEKEKEKDKEKDKEKEKEKEKKKEGKSGILKKKPWSSTYAAYNQASSKKGSS